MTKFESEKADVRYPNLNPNPYPDPNPNTNPNPNHNPNTKPNPCHRFVLDGTVEHAITIERLTTIPMPHRGKSATLRLAGAAHS
jgi:hypothetical protein